MYSDMLKEAVRALKAGETPDFDAPTQNAIEINLHVPALLPTDFCPGVNERLSIYKRFAHCETQEAIDDLQEELVDRFGDLPNQVRSLIETHRLRVLAASVGIIKIDAHTEGAVLHFKPNPPIDGLRVIQLVQQNRHIKLNGQDKLRLSADMPDLATRVTQLKNTIKALAE